MYDKLLKPRQSFLITLYSALCCRPGTRSGTDNAGCVSVQSPKTQTMPVVLQFRQRHNEYNQRKITLFYCRVINTMNTADHIQRVVPQSSQNQSELGHTRKEFCYCTASGKTNTMGYLTFYTSGYLRKYR